MTNSMNQLRGRRGVRGTRGTRGFTLVEILIVVIILGILAAIVIPQFSNATSQARTGNLQTQLQTIRQGIALYSLQHNGAYPDLNNNQWSQLIYCTDATGAASTSATPDSTHVYGPYLPSAPINPVVSPSTISTTVGPETSSTAGWYYNQAGGNFAAAGTAGGTYFNETDGTNSSTAPW
jgi:general secretion pathway protein G